MELADALMSPSDQPLRPGAMPRGDGWYDPDSVAFATVAGRTAAGLTRIGEARRREIVAALPPGLRPLTLLVRVRRESGLGR